MLYIKLTAPSDRHRHVRGLQGGEFLIDSRDEAKKRTRSEPTKPWPNLPDQTRLVMKAAMDGRLLVRVGKKVGRE